MSARPSLHSFLLLALLVLTVRTAQAEPAFPLKAQRILFVGDSITYAGGYINWLESQLRMAKLTPLPTLINLGLPSETVTGLTEDGHPFPRPNVHDRLQRALELTKPDVVVACYGMNDGIYHPFSEERFAAYRQGIDRLIETVHASGAKLVLMTPPPFDPVPLRPQGKLLPAGAAGYGYAGSYEDYDSVLKRYGQWILEQKDRVEMVIDLHAAVTAFVEARRKDDPAFTIARDGIHPNDEGHRVMGQTILTAWGLTPDREVPAEVYKLVTKRQTLLRDAWLSHVGHTRPNTRAGIPLPDALKNAIPLEVEINRELDK